MSSLGLAKNTVYKQYVFDRVGQALRENVGLYNYESLARMVGLKPTHNFRRRVLEMVREGLIEVETVFSPRGGLMNMFTAKVHLEGDYPF
jgi:hypothetical protein